MHQTFNPKTEIHTPETHLSNDVFYKLYQFVNSNPHVHSKSISIRYWSGADGGKRMKGEYLTAKSPHVIHPASRVLRPAHYLWMNPSPNRPNSNIKQIDCEIRFMFIPISNIRSFVLCLFLWYLVAEELSRNGRLLDRHQFGHGHWIRYDAMCLWMNWLVYV